MRIRDQTRTQLRQPRGPAHGQTLDKLVRLFIPLQVDLARDNRLEALVHREVQRRLDGAQVAGRKPAVQTLGSLMLQDLADTVETALVSASADLVQLQPRLHHPDRICRRAGGDTGAGGGERMHDRRVLLASDQLGEEPFTVPVCVELHGACGDDARQTRPEAFEQAAPAFNAVDGEKDVKGFAEVAERGAVEGWSDLGLRWGSWASSRGLRLVIICL